MPFRWLVALSGGLREPSHRHGVVLIHAENHASLTAHRRLDGCTTLGEFASADGRPFVVPLKEDTKWQWKHWEAKLPDVTPSTPVAASGRSGRPPACGCCRAARS